MVTRVSTGREELAATEDGDAVPSKEVFHLDTDADTEDDDEALAEFIAYHKAIKQVRKTTK